MSDEITRTIPVGVVIRRLPGVTRWAKFAWKAVALLPGAGPAHWTVLRQEGDAVEYHAATLPLELHRTETEAYLIALSDKVPSAYVVMRNTDGSKEQGPLEMVLVTASAHEGLDYTDSGEEIVEKVPLPPGLIAWIRDFVDLHHKEEIFVKRQRDKAFVGETADGIGDARIRQVADVYGVPRRGKETLQ